MPLELPNLDDRTYDDLVTEALSMIPTYAPEWTNHNPSDPGIMLIELFAYLTELLNYRLNRITDANRIAFLKLILGMDEWKNLKIRVLIQKNLLGEELESLSDDKIAGEKLPSDQKFIQQILDSQTLNIEEQTVIKYLRQNDRAVTCEDFESLAFRANDSEHVKAIKSKVKVARVKCIPRRNLELVEPKRSVEQPGHVSIIVVPNVLDSQKTPDSFRELLEAVWAYLEPKRLLTTRLHVLAPRYLTIGVRITLVMKSGVEEKTVRDQIGNVLDNFFHPLKGGLKGKGWEFGRNIYISEIYELLDKQLGVDYVEKTFDQIRKRSLDEIVVDEQRKHSIDDQLVFVEINDDELVEFQFRQEDITIKSAVSVAGE
jgi:Baseplate J-like protein